MKKIHIQNEDWTRWFKEKVLCGAEFHPLFDSESTTRKRRKATCKACLKIHGKMIHAKANSK
jgi:hypothetical protein